DADAPRHPRELFEGDRIGQRVEAGAADLLGIRHAQQPQRRGLADDLVRELTGSLEVIDDRSDASLRKVADRATNLLVLPGEREIHGRETPGARLDVASTDKRRDRALGWPPS